MNNLYKDTAWLYDTDNRDHLKDDIAFYIEYAKLMQGDVLELGCGTGRVSIALAKEGFNVTGLDLSDNMLDIFKSKLEQKPHLKEEITLVQGNMANFSLNKKFSLIIVPFRAFQLLTEDCDIVSSLSCIKDHLTQDGIFIINAFKPYDIMDENWCYTEKVQWERLDETTGNYVVKKHWGDKIDTARQIIYPHFAYEVTDKDGSVTRHTEDLALKYYFENQLAETVERAGFMINARYGWYDKRSVAEAGRELIFVCGVKK